MRRHLALMKLCLVVLQICLVIYSHNQTITSAIIRLPPRLRSPFSGTQMKEGGFRIEERNFGSRVAEVSGRADSIYPDF
jgi:hypothetical protein